MRYLRDFGLEHWIWPKKNSSVKNHCEDSGWGSEENFLSQLTQSVDALLSHHTKLSAVNVEDCVNFMHIHLQGSEALKAQERMKLIQQKRNCGCGVSTNRRPWQSKQQSDRWHPAWDPLRFSPKQARPGSSAPCEPHTASIVSAVFRKSHPSRERPKK